MVQPILFVYIISIHSLRMEGDRCISICVRSGAGFQSTPSAWRETHHLHITVPLPDISIHSLRMEGDVIRGFHDNAVCISIHSLRMEGDTRILPCRRIQAIFQSTPSAWRETAKLHRKAFFISPILVQSCKKGCKRLHSAPEKMIFFEKREKNSVRNLQHLSVRL